MVGFHIILLTLLSVQMNNIQSLMGNNMKMLYADVLNRGLKIVKAPIFRGKFMYIFVEVGPGRNVCSIFRCTI